MTDLLPPLSDSRQTGQLEWTGTSASFLLKLKYYLTSHVVIDDYSTFSFACPLYGE